MGIISEIVILGSIIFTDKWRGYMALDNNSNYEHRIVCHKYNFMSPIDDTHIQHIESFINRIKPKIKK